MTCDVCQPSVEKDKHVWRDQLRKVRLNADDLPRNSQTEREQIEGLCEIIS